MPISFEAGSVFRLIDRFSPVLREISEKLERFDALVQRTQGHLAELSEVRFAGVNRGLTAMNDRLSNLGPIAERAAATLNASFDGVNAALTRTAELSGTIAANLTRAGRGAGAAAAGAAAGAGGGGSGGGLHSMLYGRPGGPSNHAAHEIERYSRLGIAGSLAWGVWQAAELKTIVAKIQTAGRLPMGDDQTAALEAVIQKVSNQTGMPQLDAAKAAQKFFYLTPRLSPADHLGLLPSLLKYSYIESQLKNIPPEEAMGAQVGLMHLAGKYSPDQLRMLMREVAAISTVTDASLTGIATAASYSLPGALNSGLSQQTYLGLETALLQAKVGPSKVGTGLDALIRELSPKGGFTTTMAQALSGNKGAANKLSAQAELGLSEGGKPTGLRLLEAGNITAFSETLQRHMALIPPELRKGVEQAAVGTRGARILDIFAQSNFAPNVMANIAAMNKFGTEGIDKVIADYLKNSPMAQLQLAFTRLNTNLTNLGNVLLPNLTIALTGLNATLQAAFPWSAKSGPTPSGMAGVTGAGAVGGFMVAGPPGAVIGAGLGAGWVSAQQAAAQQRAMAQGGIFYDQNTGLTTAIPAGGASGWGAAGRWFGAGGSTNNPGNIRSGSGFASYPTMAAGNAALDTLLLSYEDKHHIDTLGGIITRWSPPSENPTATLIANAARRTGLDPTKTIDLHNPTTLALVHRAIVEQEHPKGWGLPAATSMPPAVAPHLVAGGALGHHAGGQVNHFTIKIDGDIPSPGEKADALLKEVNKKLVHAHEHNQGEGDGTYLSPWTAGLGGM